ncbi:MAG TPA: hypothetical protein VH165_04780 [Kofleriaceae bacterium]|jgi:hypothetical protein|nr:hypothetical protein [Kofleriaceae bacterium]
MGQHVVRRGAASTPARRPEALPTTELSQQEVLSLLRDYARATEPADLEVGVEVVHGAPGSEPASSAAAAPRFVHTLRREPVAPAGSPDVSASSLASPADGRVDVATIAMPRLKRPADGLIALSPLDAPKSSAAMLPVPSAPAAMAAPAATPTPVPKPLAGGMPRLTSRPRLEAALPAPRLMATDAIEPLVIARDSVATPAQPPLDRASGAPIDARREPPAIEELPAINPSPLAAEPRRPTAPRGRRWPVVLPIAVLLILFAVVSGLALLLSDAPLMLR